MDTNQDQAAQSEAHSLLRLSVAYLAIMYLTWWCIGVLGWCPSFDLPFLKSLETPKALAVGLMIASAAAMFLLCPLLVLSANRLRRPAVGVLVALQVFALFPLSCYLLWDGAFHKLRWYEAFGIGV
ncbi:MAG: hypothetical protein M5U25_02255 [Planctomycetota bacterium]|nr:hypothetical protein [Planctomycetota bacterium]